MSLRVNFMKHLSAYIDAKVALATRPEISILDTNQSLRAQLKEALDQAEQELSSDVANLIKL